MNTAHDQLAEIARAGAARFAQTSLASGHEAVIRRVRRHRTARAAASTVAGIGVIGGGTWGGLAFLAGDNSLTLGANGSEQPPLTMVSNDTPPSGGYTFAAQELVDFTVPAGGTVEGVAKDLASTFNVTTEQAKAALDAAVTELVPEASSTEGWVYPGTTKVDTLGTVNEAAKLLVNTRVEDLTAFGIPRDQWQTLVTKASLVEVEAKLDVDKPKVARVIQNRLQIGMKLELDSTVKYVAPNESDFTTDEERATDSPYNTYVHEGLPPGAIATPSYESIRAVLVPTDADWLYFVTINRSTGEMAYASTFEDHQKNVQKFQAWIAAQPKTTG